MSDIVKTWPAAMPPRKVLQIFGRDVFPSYFFTLGRGKPQQEIENIWFTYRGRLLGSFPIDSVECNVGQFPPLRRIDGGESEWQIKRDRWVVICRPPFARLRQKVYMNGFRGWHYFDFNQFTESMESRIAI